MMYVSMFSTARIGFPAVILPTSGTSTPWIFSLIPLLIPFSLFIMPFSSSFFRWYSAVLVYFDLRNFEISRIDGGYPFFDVKFFMKESIFCSFSDSSCIVSFCFV